jgi:hypothetical protein
MGKTIQVFNTFNILREDFQPAGSTYLTGRLNGHLLQVIEWTVDGANGSEGYFHFDALLFQPL